MSQSDFLNEIRKQLEESLSDGETLRQDEESVRLDGGETGFLHKIGHPCSGNGEVIVSSCIMALIQFTLAAGRVPYRISMDGSGYHIETKFDGVDAHFHSPTAALCGDNYALIVPAVRAVWEELIRKMNSKSDGKTGELLASTIEAIMLMLKPEMVSEAEAFRLAEILEGIKSSK